MNRIMSKLMKRANRYGRTDRRTDPNYRKAALLTRKYQLWRDTIVDLFVIDNRNVSTT